MKIPSKFIPASPDVSRSRDQWNEYFHTILHQMLDYEQSETAATKNIKLAASLADVALEELEKRWTG
jgi:hypothetical protein